MATTNEMKLEELKQENEELRELLEIQDGKLERAMFAILQLHGGLYNQISQRYILAKKNADLYGQPLLENAKATEDEELTTRQGERHELRIQQLEQTIEMLEGKIEAFETPNKQKKLYNFISITSISISKRNDYLRRMARRKRIDACTTPKRSRGLVFGTRESPCK